MTNLAVSLAGVSLQNPLVLAAGTAAYADELSDVMALEELGGIVTKAVSVAPRAGAPAPRVAEFPGGMLNAVGLANPGVDEVKRTHLPWLAAHVKRPRVFVNVVGFAVEEYAEVIARLDETPGKAGYELNVSCPNTKSGGTEFGADPVALKELILRARAATKLPLIAKLAPTLPNIAETAARALEHGVDAISVVNTFPGLAIDVERRRPVLGFGSGGVSGDALLPIGVLATWKVWKATKAPIIGLGGVRSADHLLQYVLAGATAVGMGTAALRDPRCPGRTIRGLRDWLAEHGVSDLASLRGALEWPL